MRIASSILAASAAVALGGCYTYPVYQPMPIARLTPEQSAALANRPLTQADKDRYAQAEQSVQRDDRAADFSAQQAAVPFTYGYGFPAGPSFYDYGYGYGGYPYYGGFYPYYGGLSLSFGYRGGWGGYGYRGGYGGYRGGYGGYRGGGGFHGRR